MIRLTVPSIEEDDLQAVREVLLSGQLVQGRHVADFEQAVANVVGTAHAIAVTNGTAALHMALLALDVGAGDIVVTTAYSWPATANVIELCGAQPAFVDVRPDTFNIDVSALEALLARLMSTRETARRVKAVLPVHAFGQIADMPEILELAARYGVPVVEDAACALGASLLDRQAGAWGIMGCFSFHPRKAVTTGEGGVITTNDPAIARRLRALRNHGLDPDAPTSDFVLPGFNNRMTEFQAALGLTQMRKLDRIIAARRRLASRYDALLRSTSLSAPVAVANSAPVYQSYVTLLPADASDRRGAIIADLKSRGVETTIGTWHMPMINFFRARYGYGHGDYPATDEVFARALSLPLFESMTDEQQESVVSALREVMSGKGAPRG